MNFVFSHEGPRLFIAEMDRHELHATYRSDPPMLHIDALSASAGKRPIICALVPLGLALERFSLVDPELDAKSRAQRKPNLVRVARIADYVLEHRTSWVFPSFTISFDAKTHFVRRRKETHIGELQIGDRSVLFLSDGQHRFLGLRRAARVDPTLLNETICVLFIRGSSLKGEQQLFADLNRHAKPPSKSLSILYDSNDPLNIVTTSVAECIGLFQNRIENERTFVTRRSRYLTTLSALYQANERLLRRQAFDDDEDTANAIEQATTFWAALEETIDAYRAISRGDAQPAEVRNNTILAHSLFFWAIGDVAADLIRDGMPSAKMAALRRIDWSRANREWQGLIMLGDAIVTRRQTRKALADYIRFRMGYLSEPPKRVFDERGEVIAY